jgi:hypothetical protein
MQFKSAIVATVAFATLAAASPLVARGGGGGGGGGGGDVNQCNTGSVQCCNSVQSAGGSSAAGLLALLGVVVQDVNVPIGLTCNPISVLGIGGNNCASQPVCCQNNSFNGVVAIGCTPINVNL